MMGTTKSVVNMLRRYVNVGDARHCRVGQHRRLTAQVSSVEDATKVAVKQVHDSPWTVVRIDHRHSRHLSAQCGFHSPQGRE